MSERFMDNTEHLDHAAPIMRRIGRGGNIAGWNVLILADAIVYGRDDAEQGPVYRHQVPNHGTSITALAARPGFRIGWVCMEDDAEILYCYDRDDDNFGYALNLTCPGFSEWGYAPFATVDGTPDTAATDIYPEGHVPCIMCGEPVPAPEAGDALCPDCLTATIPDDVRAMRPYRPLKRPSPPLAPTGPAAPPTRLAG